jgi:hypothetical protein
VAAGRLAGVPQDQRRECQHDQEQAGKADQEPSHAANGSDLPDLLNSKD